MKSGCLRGELDAGLSGCRGECGTTGFFSGGIESNCFQFSGFLWTFFKFDDVFLRAFFAKAFAI